MDSLLSNTLSQETIHQKTRLSRNTDTDSSPVCFEEGFLFQRVEEAVRRREALCCKEQAVRCSRRRAFFGDWSGRVDLNHRPVAAATALIQEVWCERGMPGFESAEFLAAAAGLEVAFTLDGQRSGREGLAVEERPGHAAARGLGRAGVVLKQSGLEVLGGTDVEAARHGATKDVDVEHGRAPGSERGGAELTPPLVCSWSGRVDLNHRPLGPEPSALAKLSYAPISTESSFTDLSPRRPL